MSALRVAVLISGRGSNMAAIARACAEGRIAARIVAVIADRHDAGGIALAERLGLPAQLVPAAAYGDADAFEAALGAALQGCGAELVALAGFMRILSDKFVRRYAGRMLNIHPALLPAYKGLHTHRRVLQAGESLHGVTVHYVTGELDAGPPICQGRLAVRPDDTEQTLTARVHRLEHRLYPAVIGLIAAGRLELRGDTVLLDGRRLDAPIIEDEQHEHTDGGCA